ncbi:hypothetical protein [Rhizobium sp. RCC_161_2]|uniref:hypothetical protein n=1 Tax=Rhizobium sp. RCC_161_2 TaxID=3239219 RepID=UPI00352492BB
MAISLHPDHELAGSCRIYASAHDAFVTDRAPSPKNIGKSIFALMTGTSAAVWHEGVAHSRYEDFRLSDYFMRVAQLNEFARIIGNQTDFLGPFQQSTHFLGYPTILDQMFTKCIDKTSVSFTDVLLYKIA